MSDFRHMRDKPRDNHDSKLTADTQNPPLSERASL